MVAGDLSVLKDGHRVGVLNIEYLGGCVVPRWKWVCAYMVYITSLSAPQD